MLTDQEQQNLKYLLKINEMILMIGEKQNQTLTQCISTILGIQSNKFHEIICSQLRKCFQQYTLPRKLSYIRKDITIIDEYKKYPDLHNFMKITLEMVSQIYETKITLFSLNTQGALTGLIINQKGYQQDIKLARINRSFFQVKDSLYSNHSSIKQDPSSSSQSYKLYEAFDIQPLPPKKFQSKPLQALLTKSFNHIPGSPLIKKHISLCEQRVVTPSQPLLQNSIKIPALNPVIKQFDELSLQNAVDQQQLYNAQQQLSQSIKFAGNDLTQSLTIQKQVLPSPVQQVQQSPQQVPVVQQQQQNMNNLSQEQGQAGDVFYGYYSHHMYYPSAFMMGNGQASTRNQNNFPSNFNNLTHSVSLSPGKNNATLKRLNSTLEINENERYTGRLKFFDEGKNYGFIIMDADESDIFVHCDDLQKAGINKERVRSYKQSEGILRFSFKVMSYFGKYRESRKAVELIILDDGLGMPSLYT